jgi:hypothetical protein
MPFCTEAVILFRGMPRHKPAAIDTIKKARNGLIFARDISKTNAIMQDSTINNVIMVNGQGL